MKKISDILSGIPRFSGLSERQIEELQEIVVNRHFNKGQIIFSEGDNGNGFYVLVVGLVKIFKVSAEGKEHICVLWVLESRLVKLLFMPGCHFLQAPRPLPKAICCFFPEPHLSK